MDSFDTSILQALNQFSRHSWGFDNSVAEMAGNMLIRGGIVMALFWWAWFRETGDRRRNRELVLAGIVMACVALLVARATATLLPFRVRPLYITALHFRPPYGASNFALIDWSSFPSDHAALYFSLATTLFLVSRRIGIIAFCHAFFVVCLPRIYLGLHYPTDILAGALIGIGAASLSSQGNLRAAVARPSLQWLERSPQSFYPCLYLMTLLLSSNFDPVRTAAAFAWNLVTGATPALAAASP